MTKAFIYAQDTGTFYTPEGKILGYGYAGRGTGLNNPALEAMKGIGPIPTGYWHINPPKDSPSVGKFALSLSRINIPYGRTSFYIHGDNGKNDKSASHGCIVLGIAIRQAIAAKLKDCDTLLVIACDLGAMSK